METNNAQNSDLDDPVLSVESTNYTVPPIFAPYFDLDEDRGMNVTLR